MERAEVAEEALGGGGRAPALADEGGAGEGGGPRREVAEDHRNEVVVFQHRGHGGRGRPRGDGLGLRALGPVLRLGFRHFDLGRI